MPQPLRKIYPKEQALFEGLLDDDSLREIREAQDETAFQRVGLDIETAYRCPDCGYAWSGNPKPPRPGDEKK